MLLPHESTVAHEQHFVMDFGNKEHDGCPTEVPEPKKEKKVSIVRNKDACPTLYVLKIFD